jgi:tetratricopeptide (TPR) repeat protein
MSRTAKLKCGYVFAIVALAVLSILLGRQFGGGPGLFMAIGLLLFIPGRIQGHFYREFFRGRQLLASRQPDEAKVHFLRFLRQIEESPGQRKLVWLAWTVYTPDVEAMTYNNLAACALESGDWQAAEAAATKALELDPKYPIPHVNLAIIRHLQGDVMAAEASMQKARELGFNGGKIDQLVRSGADLLAKAEGRTDQKPD